MDAATSPHDVDAKATVSMAEAPMDDGQIEMWTETDRDDDVAERWWTLSELTGSVGVELSNYRVSSLGRVQSRRRLGYWETLSGQTTSRYRMVIVRSGFAFTLCGRQAALRRGSGDGGLNYALDVPVHRLVLWAGTGPPPSAGFVVDHVNHDHSDNRLSNLRWCDSRENSARSSRRTARRNARMAQYRREAA